MSAGRQVELYHQLGISLAYDPDGTVTVESRPRGLTVRVGGGTTPGNLWAAAHQNPHSPTTFRLWEAVNHRWMLTSDSFAWLDRRRSSCAEHVPMGDGGLFGFQRGVIVGRSSQLGRPA
jgi:hypothetical protein